MSDILFQLQSATEGSRELDALIWCHLNGKRFVNVFDQPHWRWRTQCFYRDKSRSPQLVTRDGDVLDYTTNLQDAVSLVPEGMAWSISSDVNATADVNKWGEISERGQAKTASLALCIAIIKAHESKAEAA